ncbi:MAG: hypothetical protein ACP5I1_18660, partial [Candidatus Hinthialibacter sp.]
MSENQPNLSERKIPFLGVVRIIFIILVGLVTHKTAQVINPYILDNDLLYYDLSAMVAAGVLVLIESQ